MFNTIRHLIRPPAAVEQRSIHLAGTSVSYTLKRSQRRRSIGLRIDGAGLTVHVPLRASETWLQQVLQEKADWVLKTLTIWQTRQPAPSPWRDGQDIVVLGEPVTLRIIASARAAPPERQGAQLRVYVTDNANAGLVVGALMPWYQQQAITLFRARVAHYAPLMAVAPRSIAVSCARTRWGSCSNTGRLRLHWQLIKMPPSLIDYVIVHELAHLVEMNHSAAFWRVVAAACPDYMAQRRALRHWRVESHDR